MQPPAGLDANMAVDSNAAQQPHYGTNTPSVGTPIRLAPSAAAFRRATGSADKVPPPSQPGLTSSRSWISGGAGSGGGTIPSRGMDSTKIDVAAIGGKTDSIQSRSVLGHVSDLIFGW
jgi:nuclear pore complex protein Nup53